MIHVIAILGLGLVCGLWFLVQRASGRSDAVTSGTCGFCAGGVCQRGDEDGACERAAGATRTSTVKTLLGLGVLLGAGGWIGYSMLSQAEPAPVDAVTRSETLMGTAWTITVEPGEGDGEEATEAAIHDAFAEVARIEASMSEWRDDSALSAINAGAGGPPVRVPHELRDIIERSLSYSVRSGGAFDVTWLGMGRIWNVYDDDFQPPSEETIAEAMSRVDYRRIVLTADAVGLRDPGMAIGLGGIAKGYAVDRAAAVLSAAGLQNYYIDGGGDVLVHGQRHGRPWRVGVRDPRGGPQELIAVLAMGDGAVVTSGDYERYRIIDGVRYHHIIDPRTGWPAQGCISVTVVAPTAEAADALATAAFVLGPEDGKTLIEGEPQTEALLVDGDDRIHMTSGFRGLTQ